MLTRSTIFDWHVKQVKTAEDRYAAQLGKMFVAQGKSAAKELRKMEAKASDAANRQAEAIVDMIFRPEDWNRELFKISADSLYLMMAEGAAAEMLLHDLAFKMLESRIGKTTQAQEFVDRYELQIPPGVDLEPPAWFVEGAREAIRETFAQDYWMQINVTTRNDIMRTIATGIDEGWSIRQMAYAIEDRHGAEYGRVRALNVARTESGGAANAGHQIGMEHIEDDLGFEIGKQWVSALSSTTRDTHAAADGQTANGARGVFMVGGYEAPYPGHYSLPAGERCNCLCAVITDIVSDAVGSAAELQGVS